MFSNNTYEEKKEKKLSSILLDDDDDDEVLMDVDNNVDNDDGNNDDDDNVEETTPAVVEDPWTTCIESLEETVVTALDSFKMHPGIKTSNQSKGGVAEELKEILTTVLEIGAHTGPIQARSHATNNPSSRASSSQYNQHQQQTVDECVDEIYNRINRDLILPVMLEAAQSELKVSKRAAALQFFHLLYKQCLGCGSYLDKTCGNNLSISGPYGSGTSSGSSIVSNRFTLRRRNITRAVREGELLKHWVEASIGCLVTGIFTSSALEVSICSKAVLSASATIRPTLRYIAANISAADDAGATRLYKPAMCMIEGVLRRLFCNTNMNDTTDSTDTNSDDVTYDAMRSTCIKFLETVVLCFSYSTKGGTNTPMTGGIMKKKVANPADFSLDMLPTGHPIIKREVLEEIGEYAFTAMRGLVIIGGQVRIDRNLLPDILSSAHHEVEESSSKVISIIKPAVLAFLDVTDTHSSIVEYTIPTDEEEHDDDDDDDDDEEKNKNKPKMKKRILDRRNLELDFNLTQKSYALLINALSIAATTRPNLFQSAATTLGERIMDPPATTSSTSKHQFISTTTTSLNDVSTVIVTSQLKAACLTLLRNPLSVTTGGSDILLQALIYVNMSLQAQKALSVAKQQAALKTAGRAARNRAALYYQWENTSNNNATSSTQITMMSAADQRSNKRKRETDDALAKMRAAKMARGLGNGIQLPTSMVDSIELILINLEHIPDRSTIVTSKQSQSSLRKGGIPISLDYLVDAVMSNGASLQSDENRWYERDGGAAWKIINDNYDQQQQQSISKSKKRIFTFNTVSNTIKDDKEQTNLFKEQCYQASSDAFGRIMYSSMFKKASANNKSIRNNNTITQQLSNQILAKLAFLLKGVPAPSDFKVPSDFKDSYMAMDSIKKNNHHHHQSDKKREKDNDSSTMKKFLKDYPLVMSCLALDVVPTKPLQQTNKYNKSSIATTTVSTSNISSNTNNMDLSSTSVTLPNRILNEAHLQKMKNNNNIYEQSLDLFVSTIVHSSDLSNEKVHDIDRKRVSTQAASTLPLQLTLVPYVTPKSIERLSALCNMDEFKKSSLDTATKNSNKHSNNTIASNAAIHASKAAAEKRATSALLALRDIAFTKTKKNIRQSAIDCAVGIASGRISSSQAIEDKALKLIMNVIFPKSDVLADIVVSSAEKELNIAADYAIHHFDKIQEANEKLLSSNMNNNDHNNRSSSSNNNDTSEEEKNVMEKVKKPALLFMALCVRQPETIQTLMTISCRDGADVLSKAVRSNMPKLARAAATKYGSESIARKVADMVKERETPLLLAFLDNLVQIPDQDFVNACLDIQANKLKSNGKKDPRFIVPIVSVMKRSELVEKLSEFVVESDVVFKAALVRMSERLTRQAFHYREEPTTTATDENPDNNSSATTTNILGMSKCEQLVFLHFLDFQLAKIQQKRYLETIRLCIEDDEMYSDRVIMSALDYISGRFLEGDQGLPLAYMRTIILTCTKHESLHFWICHVLLPRLIEAKVYNDRRQWEGWMRCAKMLENPDTNTSGSGVSSIDAIQKLPEEQLKMYRSKYPVAT